MRISKSPGVLEKKRKPLPGPGGNPGGRPEYEDVYGSTRVRGTTNRARKHQFPLTQKQTKVNRAKLQINDEGDLKRKREDQVVREGVSFKRLTSGEGLPSQKLRTDYIKDPR